MSATTQDVLGLAIAALPSAVVAIEDAVGGGPAEVALVADALHALLGAFEAVVSDLAAGKGLEAVRHDLDDKIVDIVEAAKLGKAP